MTLYLGDNLIAGVSYPVEPTRNIGQIIQSTIPLIDAGLHLLDGSLISGAGIYSDFVNYMKGLYEEGLTEEVLEWNVATQNTYLEGYQPYRIVFDGTKFIALSTDGYISTSTDGTTWTTPTRSSGWDGYSWQALSYDGAKFIALDYVGSISTSTDGITWTTPVTSVLSHNKYWGNLAYGNGKFVAIGASGYISTSTDGTTWTTPVQVSDFYSHTIGALCYDGTKFIALSIDGYISTSADGTTWSASILSDSLNSAYTNSNVWNSISYGNGKYVAISTLGSSAISTDGITWKVDSANENLGSNHDWRALAYGSNKFIIVGSNGYISTSYIDYVLPETTFNQPTINSNGIMGGARFAVSSNVTQLAAADCGVYKAFDNDSTTQFHSTTGVKTGYIDIYNPSPIKVTNIQVNNQGAANRASSAGKIYGSNDGATWTQLKTYTNSEQSANGTWNISLSSNANFYLYYRIESTAGGSDSYWTIKQINLTATEQAYPDCFCSEIEWQTLATNAGACGKFVYNSANNTIRLPKLNGFTEGTSTVSELGDLIPAGLPNITGSISAVLDAANPQGALYNNGTYTIYGAGGSGMSWIYLGLDAARSSSVYGNSNTVQPQSVKVFYYIVIATTTKTEIEVDIDEVATDLNGKADRDLSNLSNGLANTVCTSPATTTSSASSARPAVVVENYVNGASWYRVWSDGWCEQGGVLENANGADITISFLKAFADTNYYIAKTYEGPYTGTWMATYERFYDKTSANIKTYGGSGTDKYCWYACGYIS